MKMGTLKKKGDQKTNFGPHGDQRGSSVSILERTFYNLICLTILEEQIEYELILLTVIE